MKKQQLLVSIIHPIPFIKTKEIIISPSMGNQNKKFQGKV
jgi:hypothetical protein